MHIVIPICIQMSLYAYRDGPFSNPYMHMGIKINPCMHTGIAHITVCIQGLCVMGSPYAYRDSANPCMHTGIKINPRMHKGITCLAIPICIQGFSLNPRMHTGICAIPICIWGLILIPVCIRGLCVMLSPYAYGNWSNPHIHMGIKINPRMHMYGDYMTCNPRMHMGIKINPPMHTGINQIPVCIWRSRSIPICIQGLHVM